jgi:hypothetical protein
MAHFAKKTKKTAPRLRAARLFVRRLLDVPGEPVRRRLGKWLISG